MEIMFKGGRCYIRRRAVLRLEKDGVTFGEGRCYVWRRTVLCLEKDGVTFGEERCYVWVMITFMLKKHCRTTGTPGTPIATPNNYQMPFSLRLIVLLPKKCTG